MPRQPMLWEILPIVSQSQYACNFKNNYVKGRRSSRRVVKSATSGAPLVLSRAFAGTAGGFALRTRRQCGRNGGETRYAGQGTSNGTAQERIPLALRARC